MSLKSILADCASILGLDVTNPVELGYYYNQINTAAKELYDSCDLPGCLREQLFQHTNDDTTQISLPYYVGNIRAIRYASPFYDKVNLKNMQPRYHKNSWGNVDFINYRIKRTDSPLAKDIVSGGQLTFKLSSIEASDVTIDLVARTVNSEKLSERITIVAGTLSASSVMSPLEVFSITKFSGPNNYDITILDIDNREMAVIPNSELSPSYTVVQVRDGQFVNIIETLYSTIEVLYKLRFKPFVNLSDEFICPNCDKLIFWKFAEHYASYKPGWEDRSILAAKKVSQIKNDILSNDEVGKDMDIEFGANPFYKVQEDMELCHKGSGYYLGYNRYSRR